MKNLRLEKLQEKLNIKKLKFDGKLYQSLLNTEIVGRNVVYIKSTGSTMTIAKDLIDGKDNHNLQSGTIIIADEQTKGKGRNNRNWSSLDLDNIYCTMIFDVLQFETNIMLNFIIPIGICKSINDIINDENKDNDDGKFNVQIKWPNDVWINNKKVSGMLLNTSNGVTSIGIGINVNEYMGNNETVNKIATSIRTSVGKIVSREKVLARLCNHIEELLTFSFSDVMDIYKGLEMLVGNIITIMPKAIEDSSKYYTAKAIGYTAEGFLKVEYKDKDGVFVEKTLTHQEVSTRLFIDKYAEQKEDLLKKSKNLDKQKKTVKI